MLLRAKEECHPAPSAFTPNVVIVMHNFELWIILTYFDINQLSIINLATNLRCNPNCLTKEINLNCGKKWLPKKTPWKRPHIEQKSEASQPTMSVESWTGVVSTKMVKKDHSVAAFESPLWPHGHLGRLHCQQHICLCWSWTGRSPSHAPSVMKESPIVMVSRITTQITVTSRLGSDLFPASLLGDLWRSL